MKGFSYSIKKLAALCDAKLIGFSTEDLIYQVFIDSRKAKYPDNHLFIALKGPRHDGHQFIPELYEKGFRNFLVNHTYDGISSFPEGNFLVVENSLESLYFPAKVWSNSFRGFFSKMKSAKI